MRRLAPLSILLAACGPTVVNCPPGHYVDKDGLCVEDNSDTATPSIGDDDDVDPGIDSDGDGFAPADGDCDDANPSVNPDALEDTSNGVDDDCDRSIDELEFSMADRIVEASASTECDAPATWAAYRGEPLRYLAVTLVRVGTDGADDLPSLAEAESALERANAVLGSANIELFVGDAGVLYDSTFHDLDPDSFADLRNLYDDDGTLHLFVTNTVTDIQDERVGGLAAAPGGARKHGLAIGADALADERTLAHLVGHALGLVHTHAGTATGTDVERVDGSNCGDAGDRLCDTPADPGPSWSFADGCAVNADACSLSGCGNDDGGDPFVPDLDNAMSGYPDHCDQAAFSDDQSARMHCSADLDLPGLALLDQPAIAPILEIDSYVVDDNSGGGSTGDNDGVFELGETVELHVDITNRGAVDAANVVGTLTDNQAIVDVLLDQAGTQSLPVGGTATLTYIARVPLDCTTDVVTTFTLNLSDDAGGSWTETFDVPVTCDAIIDVEAVTANVPGGTLRLGQATDFEIRVLNDSLVPLSTTTADLYLSADATIDPATDEFVCRLDSTDTIAPGAAQTLTTTCAVPSTLGAGNWRLGFIADPDDVLAETDESNNVAVAATTTPVESPPNLTVRNVVATPNPIGPGADLTVNYERANDGGSNAGAFDIDVYLSNDATITAADIPVCTVGVPNSPLGEDVARSVTCAISPSAALGSYYVGVVIDEPDDIAESDETDNVAVSATTLLIDENIDLQATLVNILDTSGFPGGLMDVDFEMVNNGTADAAGFDVGILFSSDGTVTSADTLACSIPVPGTLAGGDSIVLAFTNCEIPDLTRGDYTVGIWLDNGGDLAETNEGNNILADTNDDFTILGVDLTVSDVQLVDTSGNPGDDMRVDYLRENVGNADSGSFRLSVRVSADATITGADTEACYSDITNSPAGEARSASLGCTAPSLSPGTYYVGVMVDSQDDVPEDDENNNIGVTTGTYTIF